MANDATPFLIGTRQETRNVLKGEDGDVEGVAEAHKSCGFVARINVKTTGKHLWLVGDNTDGVTTKVAKANHDVLGPISLNFHETAVVQHLGDDIEDIVGFGRVFRDDAVKRVA